MGVDNGRNATDLHFTLWQKEANIEVKGWDYTLKKRHADGGEVLKQVDFGDSGLHDDDAYRASRGFPTNDLNHAADVTITGLDIPYCTKLWLRTSLHLTEWNTLRKRDLEWSFDQDPPDDEGLPLDEGFIFTDYEPDPNHPGKFKVTYSITNDEPTRWFRVTDLFFLLDGSQNPIDDPEDMLAWNGWSPFSGGALDLAPYSEFEIVLENLDSVPWLFTKLVKQEITGDGGDVLGDPIPTIQIHEVPAPSATLALGCAGLLAASRRRRRG